MRTLRMAIIGLVFGYLLGLLFSITASAYEVPKDAVIKVFDASGKQIGEMSRREYKVVKIEDDIKLQQERLNNKEYKESHYSAVFHVGAGAIGNQRVGHDGSNHTVRSKEDLLLGVSLCYTKNTIGLCGTAVTDVDFRNGLGLIGIKKDF